MTHYRGLTWDHPRGTDALRAAAAAFSADGPDTLTWEAQPLEGFESAPIERIAAEFDLVVLDHPHLGDARAHDALHPLDALFSTDELTAWSDAAVGPSFTSYVLEGRPWALPLDAATQVAAWRPDALDAAPATWDEAVALASRTARVAPSLAGPHAFLSWCSIAVGLGEEPARGDILLSRATGAEALRVLRALHGSAPAGTIGQNPISLLERLRAGDDLDYLPLVYGYVTYAQGEGGVRFGAPPTAGPRIGSTLGGTGIAISRRCSPSAALIDHLRALMSSDLQRGLIPAHAGQPSARAAWTDEAVDSASGGFYSGTLTTIDQAWVRPRFAGYIPFQSAASALLRAGVTDDIETGTVLHELEELFHTARAAAATPERMPA